MADLGIEEYITQLKSELFAMQERNRGESAFLKLEQVELELTVTATLTGGGKVKLAVAELGSDIAKEQSHNVKLTFSIVSQPKPTRRPESLPNTSASDDTGAANAYSAFLDSWVADTVEGYIIEPQSPYMEGSTSYTIRSERSTDLDSTRYEEDSYLDDETYGSSSEAP